MNIASKFKADAPYAVGTVVSFGGEEEVTAAASEDSRFAGVVTDKSDLILNNAIRGDNVVTVAVIGRTSCEVCGPVDKGDVLTIGCSGLPESANRKFNDLTDAQLPGTVVGRAIGECGSGMHTIEIFINAA